LNDFNESVGVLWWTLGWKERQSINIIREGSCALGFLTKRAIVALYLIDF